MLEFFLLGLIGGLAMLRNISNMMKASVPIKVIEEGLNSIQSSMLLPFDFLKKKNKISVFNAYFN